MPRAGVPDTAVLLSPAPGLRPVVECGCECDYGIRIRKLAARFRFRCLKINELSWAEWRGGVATLFATNSQQLVTAAKLLPTHRDQGGLRAWAGPGPEPGPPTSLPHATRIRIRICPWFFLPLCILSPLSATGNVICAKFSLQSLLIVYVRCFIKT